MIGILSPWRRIDAVPCAVCRAPYPKFRVKLHGPVCGHCRRRRALSKVVDDLAICWAVTRGRRCHQRSVLGTVCCLKHLTAGVERFKRAG